MHRLRKQYLGALGVLAALSVAGLAALRAGALGSPGVLAALVGLLTLGLAGEGVWTATDAVRRAAPKGRLLARTLLAAGGLLVTGGGLANWLFGLQADVILSEGQVAPLFREGRLQAFDAGPLADPEELEVALRLDEVSLQPAGDGSFWPVSRVTPFRGHAQRPGLVLGGGRFGADGTLRFHAGAFGYAPRVVILDGERDVFDETVPFTTRRDEGREVRFEGAFRIERLDLDLEGRVRLDGLDTRMKGHPILELAVRRDGEVLAAGPLTPGRFAELPGGLRVGYAGLRKWSEIVVARRNYPEPMWAGAGLLVLGAALLFVTRRRR